MQGSQSKGIAILEEAYQGIQAGYVETSLDNLKLSLLDYRAELGPPGATSLPSISPFIRAAN